MESARVTNVRYPVIGLGRKRILLGLTESTVLAVYVDDIVLAFENEATCKLVKDFLSSQYTVSDLGELKWYLGMHVEQTPKHIKIHQHSYVEQVLARFKMTECNTEKTPLAAGVQFSSADCPQTEEAKLEMT